MTTSDEGLGTFEDQQLLEASLQGLAEILLSEQSVEVLLANVTNLAAAALPGCDAASVTLLRDGRATTPVWSAELALHVDQSQYDAGEGPCLAAIATASAMRIDSFAEDERWPAFAEAARSKGVVSSLALPLWTGRDVVGALNLYSRRPENFRGVEEQALVFATQASVTVSNAQALERSQQLAQHLAIALENRDVIGQAKGILMTAQAVSSDEAFDMLRRASQRSNRKLHEIAREIVERRGDGRGTP